MNSPRFPTIIFDLDGTLVDTLLDLAEAANEALRSLGFPPHPPESYRRFVGDGLSMLAARMVPRGSDELAAAEAAERFMRYYQRNWDRLTRPYPGIEAMLATLRREQVNLGVLSNKPDDFTKRFPARFFPGIDFGLVFGHRQGLPKKPDPHAALEIAAYFGTDPCSCLMIGDSGVDVRTGRAAGMTAIGVTWGFRERAELEAAGADLIVDHPEEILAHVFRAD